MWSTVRTVAARGLLTSHADKTAVRRIATSAVAYARPRPRSALFLTSLCRSQPRQQGLVLSRSFTASAWLQEDDAPAKKPARKTAKKSKTATKSKTTKTAAKKEGGKKKVTAKKTKKAKKPAAKKKVTAKKPRKTLTPEQQLKAKVKALKAQALLTEPARLSQHPWSIFVSERAKGAQLQLNSAGRADIGPLSREISVAYKSLPPFELQRLQEQAVKNTETNTAAHKAWVASHTPVQIHEANLARRHINRLTSSKHRPIRDERLPKRPQSAFGLFSKSQWDAGKFAGLPIPEAGKRAALQWKVMSAPERQPFDDAYNAELERYAQEVETVLGRTIRSSSPSPSHSE